MVEIKIIRVHHNCFFSFIYSIIILSFSDNFYFMHRLAGRFLAHFDHSVIHFFRKISRPLARVALFTVFFWFGILKVFGYSPANPLVEALQRQTLPFMTFGTFIIFFGLFEMLIGVLFVYPGFERLAIACLIPHMVTTCLPLVLLPQVVWQGFLVPTLEGQYIIKNLIIVALAFSMAGGLHPWREPKPH